MNHHQKIKSLSEILRIAEKLKHEGKIIVTTNGAFDILHVGHIRILEQSKSHGDILIAGVNSDDSVKRYKSPDRPIIPDYERAEMVASCEFVDYVFIFDELNPIAFLEKIKPNIHTNCADYGENCIERETVEKNRGKLVLIDRYQGTSTTEMIAKIKSLPTETTITLKGNRIIIFCLPGIGDALMATPMIKLLKQNYPEAKIDIATMFGAASYVFKNNPNINEIFQLSLYGQNQWQGLKQAMRLKRHQYDFSLLAFPAYRREYHFIHWLAGAKRKIAHQFNKGYWSEFNFLATDLVAVNEDEHNVINNMNLLKPLGIDWEKLVDKSSLRYNLILDKADLEYGERFIQKTGWEKEKIAGIHPGSTKSPAALLRRWPVERYAKVAKFLISNGKKVIIFVGPDEQDIGQKLNKLVNDNNCILNINRKFGQSLGILRRVDLLICNDNGFGHLANALGRPIITLWASTNDKWSLPYYQKLVTLIRPQNFQPWYRYDLKTSIPKKAKGGMKKIKISSVIKAITH